MISHSTESEIPTSPLARWDARWKLAALLIAAFGIASLEHLNPSLAGLALGLLLLALSRLPRQWVCLQLGLFGLAALPFVIVLPFTLDLDGPGWDVGPVRVSERGLEIGLAIFCRCEAIGCLTLVLLGTAPFHHLLASANRLKVPGVLVLLLGLAYRYAFLLSEEYRRIRIALRTRGFRMRANSNGYRVVGHVIGAALVRGSDRAERVTDAMRCRGFDGTFRTTIAFQTTASDVISFLVVVVLICVLLLWDLDT